LKKRHVKQSSIGTPPPINDKPLKEHSVRPIIVVRTVADRDFTPNESSLYTSARYPASTQRSELGANLLLEDRRMFFRIILPATVLFCLATAMVAQPKSAPKILVFFTEWSAQLNDADKSIIASAAATANRPGGAHVIITGYADRLGSSAADMELSTLRAQIVRDAMELDGVPANQMQMVAAGAQSGPAGVINRRVEIAVGSDR
jgi:outer membrane protein OmpA-like peptidoglycan-associated protein